MEGRIGFVRRNWFVPPPSFHHLAELNAWLLAQCRADQERIPAGRTLCIAAALDQERRRLRPLPHHTFDPSRTLLARADHHALVRFEGSRYSVPTPCAFQPVTIRAYVERVVFSVGEREVACHPRAHAPDQLIQAPEHFLSLLKRKPALLDHARVFRDWKLPAVFHRYRAALLEAGGDAPEHSALRSLAQVLSWAGRLGLPAVERALEQALQTGRLQPEAIAQALGHSPDPPGDAPLPRSHAWPCLHLPRPDLGPYQQLLRQGAARTAPGRPCFQKPEIPSASLTPRRN